MGRNKKLDVSRWCWENGQLAWMLHKGQQPIYEAQCALKSNQTFVTVCARQFGKTLGEIVYLDEYARRNAGCSISFAAPTQDMATKTVVPVWREILNGLGDPDRACPEDLRPHKSSTEGCWVYPNGSRVYLAGTDTNDRRLRDWKANLVVVDEAGFHVYLDEVINSILYPQLDQTRGNMLISTTPPSSMSHPFMEYWEQARRKRLLITKTLFDNPMRTPEDIRSICVRQNPKATEDEIDLILTDRMEGSPSWQREYLCKMVTDRNLQVIPEFDHLRHVRDLPRPRYFQPYVFMDFGFQTDYSAALFCYLDFSTATLVVEDELLGRRLNSREWVLKLVDVERRLWGAHPDKTPVRYADSNSQQQIYDMQTIFNYPIAPASKQGGVDGMVNNVREVIGADRLSVNPRCVELIRQLREGTWKADRLGQINPELKFDRSEKMGHLDCIAALMYGVRSVDWRRNPTPKGLINDYTHFYLGPEDGGERETTRRLKNFFDVN